LKEENRAIRRGEKKKKTRLHSHFWVTKKGKKICFPCLSLPKWIHFPIKTSPPFVGSFPMNHFVVLQGSSPLMVVLAGDVEI